MLYSQRQERRGPAGSAATSFTSTTSSPSPRCLKEGIFKKGDVLVSLRNINTIFVFNRENDKIKFIPTGSFVRQHDPDFVDGETISVFDNHPVRPLRKAAF